MRIHASLGLVLTLGLLCAGCSMYENIGRNLFVDPAHYPQNLGRYSLEHRSRKAAEATWAAVAGASEQPYSEHYACGFKEGYADYLVYGGNTEPPLVPPRRYWRRDYQTPAGQLAIQDWFAGFKEGAVRASGTGYRELVTIPLSLPPQPRPIDHPPGPNAPVLPSLPGTPGLPVYPGPFPAQSGLEQLPYPKPANP